MKCCKSEWVPRLLMEATPPKWIRSTIPQPSTTPRISSQRETAHEPSVPKVTRKQYATSCVSLPTLVSAFLWIAYTKTLLTGILEGDPLLLRSCTS